MSPSTQERIFRKEYAIELLRIAQMDLKTARFLLDGLEQGKIRGEHYFFVVQQCIEKLIKAVLVHLELPVPMVHELGILLAKVPRGFEPPFGYEINALSEFATVRRYEEGSLEWGKTEAVEAMGLAESAWTWAGKIVD